MYTYLMLQALAFLYTYTFMDTPMYIHFWLIALSYIFVITIKFFIITSTHIDHRPPKPYIFTIKSKYNIKYKLMLILWIHIILMHPNFLNKQYKYNETYQSKFNLQTIFHTNRVNIFCIVITLKQIENNYNKIKQASNNKINHTINGNKNKNTKLNLLLTNKGNANFENKINETQITISSHKPDIMCISEANLKASTTNIGTYFPDYNIELNKMSNNINISRNILLINNKISYKRRLDLEDEITCTIWIQVNIPKKKPILIMGGYRQWQLLKILDKSNTKTPKKQLERWQSILDKWKKALDEKRDTIVMMDDNIDTNKYNSHNKNYNIIELYERLQQHLIDYGLTIHNNNFTRYVPHQPPSCLDHITSNCSNKISNVKTHRNVFSDHCVITAQYDAIVNIYHPKFIKSRNNKLLNGHTLKKYIKNSYLLNSVFRHSDPELITNIIQIELNSIINAIAPQKIVQYKKDFCPYFNGEIVEKLKISNDMLNEAISSNDQNKWRDFKNYRNSLSKITNEAKSNYCRANFKDKNKQWKFLKSFNNSNKQQIPNNITYNNKQITSPKEIATISNNFFIDKINKIRETFTPTDIDPIKLLSQLIPRTNDCFIIPEITIKQTQQIIRSLKNSNSKGHDEITNKILKKINNEISPHLTHMINSIVRTSTIPDIFKISRVLPISKPDKPLNCIDSFRPINNLPSLEKILEEHIIINLNIFLNNNNIIHKNHHGGRKGHSTTTALAQINNILLKNNENNKITAALSTDLSAAFDTVDNFILLNKLEHYGIRGKSLDLFKSYLNNHKQFVEIDTYKSQTKNLPPCSVVQGGKLSGCLYTLYTNEIPLLCNLMHNEWFLKITKINPIKYKNIIHITVNFVDDFSNLI